MLVVTALSLVLAAAAVMSIQAGSDEASRPEMGFAQTVGPKATPRPTVEPPLHTPPTRVPRPDNAAAMSVDDARRELTRNVDLAAVIKAAEAGDAGALMTLAKRTPSGVCDRGRRGTCQKVARTEVTLWKASIKTAERYANVL